MPPHIEVLSALATGLDDSATARARVGRSRRGDVRAIGMAFGAMTSYRINASVTFGAGNRTDDGGWQPLFLKTARYLTVNAAVNGVAVRAIIDTGASRSVISKKLANHLALPVSGVVDVVAFTKKVRGSLHKIRELKVGSELLRNADLASFDLSNVEQFTGQPLPLLIGQDILSRVALEVQFPNDRARFANLPSATTSSVERLSIAFSRSHLPLIQVGMTDGFESPAVLDLGSDVVCAVSESFAKKHRLAAGRRTSNTLTVGLDGESVNTIFCLPRMRIGGYILREVPIVVVSEWKFSSQINIGWPCFAAFSLFLDLRASIVTLNADRSILASSFPKDRSGIGAARLADRILVRHVASGSPAEQIGLKPGDEIICLDGRRIDPTHPPAGRRQGFQPAGTSLVMTLADGRNMTLTLADYF